MHFVGEIEESLLASAGTPQARRNVNDTSFLNDDCTQTEGKSPDRKNLKGSMLGHFEMIRILSTAERQYVTKKLEDVFGASHHRMAFLDGQLYETFSSQPTAENTFRFPAEWQKRAVNIEG